MNAPGVIEVPLLAAPSREDQLQAEVNELHATIERMRCTAGERPFGPTGDQECVSIGGGLVAEADGWVWLVWRGRVYAVCKASPEDVHGADELRERIRREKLEAQAKRGWLS